MVKYLSLWNYSYDPLYLSVSKELWDSLNDQEKAVFQKAADEAMAYQVQITREQNEALLNKLGEYKLDVGPSLTQDQVRAFQEAVGPVYQDYKEEFGEDLFNSFGYHF